MTKHTNLSRRLGISTLQDDSFTQFGKRFSTYWFLFGYFQPWLCRIIQIPLSCQRPKSESPGQRARKSLKICFVCSTTGIWELTDQARSLSSIGREGSITFSSTEVHQNSRMQFSRLRNSLNIFLSASQLGKLYNHSQHLSISFRL